MHYAWDTILTALVQDIDRTKLRFLPTTNASPYLEASFIDLNADALYENSIEVNPLFRFTHIFMALVDVNLSEKEQLRQVLFDIFVHYQSQIDLRQGLTKDEYYIRAILRDILGGVYGKEIARDAYLFSNNEMKAILYGLLSLTRTGISIELFRRVMRVVYPNALVYRNNDVYREILIYFAFEKNDEEIRKIDFLVSMFLDVNYTVYVFWEHHFGIIDVDATLEFNNMLIF